MGKKKYKEGGMISSGGWCFPQAPVYDFLPVFKVNRGKISYDKVYHHDTKNQGKKMGNKDRYIKELEERNIELTDDVESLEEQIQYLAERNSELYRSLVEMKPASKKTRKKYAGNLAFDFWPPTDWFRFGWTTWNPGKYAQIVVGPFRFDWFASE